MNRERILTIATDDRLASQLVRLLAGPNTVSGRHWFDGLKRLYRVLPSSAATMKYRQIPELNRLREVET